MSGSGAGTSGIALRREAEYHRGKAEDGGYDPEPAGTREVAGDAEDDTQRLHGYRDEIEAGQGANQPDGREDTPRE